MIKIKEKNYKSDFDAILHLYRCRKDDSGEEVREEVDFPPYDWTARFYAGTDKANPYVASCIGGVCTNCFNDNGRIHVVFNGHRMGLGRVSVEFTAQIPDAIYPDGLRQEVRPQPLDVELVNGPGDCGCDIDLAVVLPYAVVTAYESAVQAGFAGTAEEYYAGLSLLPALSAATSDLAAAKAEVAAALRLHGVDVADTDSLHDMADKVAHLRLAVPGEPGVVDHGWRGLGVPDLLNALRNNTRPADYPYMWAAATPQQEVPLAGADAYLCSDGFFITEQGVTHTFADPTRENWVIYYNRGRRYTVANTIGYVTGICVLSGTPSYSLADRTGYTTVGPVHSYTDDLPGDGEVTDINLDAPGVTSIYLRGVRRCVGASHICDNVAILAGAVVLPDLEEIDVANNCWIRSGNIRMLSMPALSRLTASSLLSSANKVTELSLPALSVVYNTNVAISCPSLRRASLPALAEFTGGTAMFDSCAALADVDLSGLRNIDGYLCSLFNYTPGPTTISLPSLERYGVAAIFRGTSNVRRIDLPRLRDYGQARGDHGLLWGGVYDHDVDIYMPAVVRSLNYLGYPALTALICGITGSGSIHVHFGAQQDADLNIAATYHSGATRSMIHLHVAPGFRSSLPVAYTYAGTTREELLDLIANLADNTGHTTHTITLGATLLGLLTDDEIALATAKNYTLS